MRISELIILLEQTKETKGDIEIKIFAPVINAPQTYGEEVDFAEDRLSVSHEKSLIDPDYLLITAPKTVIDLSIR